MFSSPSIRIYSQENMDTTARKPGNSEVYRKPLMDKAVNSGSLAKTPEKKQIFNKKPEPKKTSLEDNEYDYFCSYKEVTDSFYDFELGLKPGFKQDVINTIGSYCMLRVSTPPPEDICMSKSPMFSELPTPIVFDHPLCDEGLFLESIEEPELDFQFDDSV